MMIKWREDTKKYEEEKDERKKKKLKVEIPKLLTMEDDTLVLDYFVDPNDGMDP